MDVCFLLFLICLYMCVCVRFQIQGRLRECRSIRPGASRLPYYCTPFVCIPAVIGLLAVWRHNKPKTKNQEGHWFFSSHRVLSRSNKHSLLLLIERTPPPGGRFLFTMFPHQEPRVRGPPSKHLEAPQILRGGFEVLRGGSSYSRFLMREHSK